ncbi:ABC transporter substrate-binding protein [Vibrio rotiferianus]|uniref:ABC transporter substrate-binding protein n=1 Tax=Vibrio rotiferianus TaxID=190895 RepID=UPI0005EF0E71|nr:ABC transporter substrate-binding protein [Vibrio rotiferianus]
MNDVNLRYLDLLSKVYAKDTDYLVSLSELEEVLCTSRRNTSIIMKKLSSFEWIDWKPSVGRGKLSLFKIKISLQQAIVEFLILELTQGRTKPISKLLDWFGQTAVRALNIASEAVSLVNESNNSVLISSYPWVSKIDPVKTFRHTELHISKSVYDVLLRQDSHGEICAGLAHSWEVEGKTVKLWLRPDIYRHDGELLELEDVVWSLSRLMELSGPVQAIWRCVDHVKAEKPNIVTITLKYANPFFTYMLTTPHASILSRKIKCFETGFSYYLGTGPFKISDWSKERLILKVHKEYFSTRALLDQIILSHGDLQTQNMLSFNEKVQTENAEKISALSYLTYRKRANSGISTRDWHELANYISFKKRQFDPENSVDSVRLVKGQEVSKSIVVPQLMGTIVLAEPMWTIPSLARYSKWLHDVIVATGLQLEIVRVNDVSSPESASEFADIFFIEDVIEAPFSYGVFEWLSTSTGLRFAYTNKMHNEHCEEIKAAIECHEPHKKLLDLEQKLRTNYTYLPLFVGSENVFKTTRVKGVQVKSTGYSDLHLLWVDSHS